jgi:hypothetical protein
MGDFTLLIGLFLLPLSAGATTTILASKTGDAQLTPTKSR